MRKLKSPKLKAEGIRRAFRDAREKFELLFAPPLQPAYAGIPSNVMLFDVGSFPKKGTPSRDVMEWKNVEVGHPNGGSAGGGKALDKAPFKGVRSMLGPARKDGEITIEEAKEEVGRMLKSDGACHEYLAYEAAKLCGHPEAIGYTMHIMVGASGEDYMFRPGEKLEDLYVKKPVKQYKSAKELADHIMPESQRETQGFIKGLFTLIARLWRQLTGSVEDDAINRPYMAHFYDPRRNEGDRGLNVAKGEIRFQSALSRAKGYWDTASEFYAKGEKAKAYCALGHIVHLICDMHVPAHVHNDIHGPTVFLGKLDSLEQWAKRRDFRHLQRGKGKMNITIWDAANCERVRPDGGWTQHNSRLMLARLIKNIVSYTQQFRSVDAEGEGPGQDTKGALSDNECYMQASFLIPRAIESSARLIANFISVHEGKEGKGVA